MQGARGALPACLPARLLARRGACPALFHSGQGHLVRWHHHGALPRTVLPQHTRPRERLRRIRHADTIRMDAPTCRRLPLRST